MFCPGLLRKPCKFLIRRFFSNMWLVTFAQFTVFAILNELAQLSEAAHQVRTTSRAAALSTDKAAAVSTSSRVSLKPTAQSETSPQQYQTTLNSQETSPFERSEKSTTNTPISTTCTPDAGANNDGIVKTNLLSLDTDFAFLTSTNRFVDKTKLIRHLCSAEKLVTSISAPRKFGKSVSINMLRRFFEMTMDKNGNHIPAEKSDNYATFSKPYFNSGEHLDIFKDRVFFSKHFASRPVLTLNFDLLDCQTEESFDSSVYAMLRDSLSSMRYLKYSNKLDVDSRQLFREIENPDKTLKARRNVSNDLFTVTKCLHTYFGNQSLVLIDELDAPFRKVLINERSMFKRREWNFNIVNQLLQVVMSTLFESNKFVWKGLCVGQIELSKIFPFDYFDHHSFHASEDIASLYGSTYEEIDHLRKQYQEKGNEVDMNIVKEMYEGYKRLVRPFKHPSVIGKEEGELLVLFNTFSVREYFESGNPTSHWCAADPPPYLDKMLFGSNMLRVRDSVLGYEVLQTEFNAFGLEDLELLKKCIASSKCPIPWPNRQVASEDMLMRFLLELGYYSLTKVEISDCDNFTLAVPNNEIRKFLFRSFQRWTIECLNPNIPVLESFVKSLDVLSNTFESQQEFVDRFAALFENSIRLPKDDDQFINVILLLITERKEDHMKLEYLQSGTEAFERSCIVISRLNMETNKRAIIIIKAVFDDYSKAALKKLIKNRSVLSDDKYRNASEIFLMGLNFNPISVTASIIYNETRLEAAQDYRCNIHTVNRYKKKVWSKIREWGKYFGV